MCDESKDIAGETEQAQEGEDCRQIMKLEVAGKEERDLKATSGLSLAAGIEANKLLPAGNGREPRSRASTQLCGLLAKLDGPH